jgi:hypothetical protein
VKAILIRLHDDTTQTLGKLMLFDGMGRVLELWTLEPPWRGNARNESCIPLGNYDVRPRQSPKYGEHFEVRDVTDRSYILVHAGNYAKDTEGCILVGLNLADINGDGVPDVTTSRVALERLRKYAPGGFSLTVTAL